MSVRLDNETLHALKRIALERGRSLSEITRGVLQEYAAASMLTEPTMRTTAKPSPQKLRIETERRMTGNLVRQLKEARDQAPDGDVVVRIHIPMGLITQPILRVSIFTNWLGQREYRSHT